VQNFLDLLDTLLAEAWDGKKVFLSLSNEAAKCADACLIDNSKDSWRKFKLELVARSSCSGSTILIVVVLRIS
jgi:hypothetical protein